MAAISSLTLRVIALGLLFTTAACKGGDAAGEFAPDVDNRTSASRSEVDLQITNGAGRKHDFTVELAIGREAQQHGLMGRTSLREGAGMLFPFTYPIMASFWMKNTMIPLDLLFIRADGTIASILQGEPGSLRPLASNEPVAAVLEINGGRAETLGIAVGDRVTWGDCERDRTPPGVWRADAFCPDTPQ